MNNETKDSIKSLIYKTTAFKSYVFDIIKLWVFDVIVLGFFIYLIYHQFHISIEESDEWVGTIIFIDILVILVISAWKIYCLSETVNAVTKYICNVYSKKGCIDSQVGFNKLLEFFVDNNDFMIDDISNQCFNGNRMIILSAICTIIINNFDRYHESNILK